MGRKKAIVLIFVFALFAFTGCQETKEPVDAVAGYPDDFMFVEVPNPLSGENKAYLLGSEQPPAIGQQFKDSNFNTLITQATDRGKIRHEYSRFDPFNSDQSMILLLNIDKGDNTVFKTDKMPYEKTENKVMMVDISEPRWDPDDPEVLWGLNELKIIRLNVETKERQVVKDFSEDEIIKSIIDEQTDIDTITMKDEGESSQDKRFWALALQCSREDQRIRYVFCWDGMLDKTLGFYEVPSGQAEIDWVGMSAKGTFVIIGSDEGEGKHAGLTIANRQLTEFHKLANATAHSDVGLDIEGNEVIVMKNNKTDYIDLIPLDFETEPVSNLEDYETSTIRRLIRLFYDSESKNGFNSGVHISCNFSGYCVVSTYIEPGVIEQNWLDRSIVLARLDSAKPSVFYLAKVYNTTQEYWEETQATITNDGSKVMWTSNWNQDVGQEKVFELQLDMPSDWTKKLE